MYRTLKAKTFWTAAFLLTCSLQLNAQDAPANNRFDAGLVGLPSLAYGEDFALSYSGTGLVAGFDLAIASFLHARAGIDAELNTMGTIVFAPLGLSAIFAINGELDLDLRVEGLIGAALYRPSLLAAAGAQASVGIAWFPDATSGFEFRFGARYFVVPEYEAKYGTYSFFDLPLEIAAVFKL